MYRPEGDKREKGKRKFILWYIVLKLKKILDKEKNLGNKLG